MSQGGILAQPSSTNLAVEVSVYAVVVTRVNAEGKHEILSHDGRVPC